MSTTYNLVTIAQLTETLAASPSSYLALQAPDGTYKKVKVSNLLAGQIISYLWISTSSYSLNDIVEYAGKFWKSLTAGIGSNTGHVPQEDANWTEVQPADESGVKVFQVNKVYKSDVVVVMNALDLYSLKSSVTRPYTAASFIGGDWDLISDSIALRDAAINTAVSGLKWKTSVKVASTANLTLSGTQTIDGISTGVSDRILVKDQTTQTQNGIYIVASGAWTRSTDADTSAELTNAIVPVEQGTANADSTWRQTADGITLGSSNIVFASFGSVSPAATETVAGIAEIATQAETNAGTDDARMVSPLKLKSFADAAYWKVGGASPLGAAVTITGTASNTLKFQFDTLNTTLTNGAGHWLINTAAAGAGAQQISPLIVQEGQGWKTNATAGSQSVRFAHYVLPVQGSANPSGNWILAQSINGGAYGAVLTITSAGAMTVAADISMTGTLTVSGARSVSFSGGAGSIKGDTNSGIVFQSNYSSTALATGVFRFFNVNGSYTATSGTVTEIGATGSTFAPPSGTAIFNQVLLSNTVNLTGGANGQVTWVNASPTITAAVDVTGYLWDPVTPGNISGAHYAFKSTSGKVQFKYDGLAATLVDGAGVWLQNSTAAAAGAQQNSPSTVWEGQGWKTNATAGPQSVKFSAFVLPVQGAANPTGQWTLSQSINGVAYAAILTVNSNAGAVSFTAGGANVLGIGINRTPATDQLQYSSTFTIAGQNAASTLTITGGAVVITQGSLSSSWTPAMTVTPGTHTSMTASTEFPDIIVAAATHTWAAGTLATQRSNWWKSPTIAFASASVATNVFNGYFEPPLAGSNATITNPWALAANGYFGVKIGNTSTFARGGGSLFDIASSVQSTSTTETDLFTMTTAANTLFAIGDKIKASFSGTFVAHATANRRLRVYFGGTAIFDTAALLFTSGTPFWQVDITIYRVSVGVINYTAVFKYATSPGSSLDLGGTTKNGQLGSLTLSSTNVFKLTGQAGAAGAADGDIILTMGDGQWLPVTAQ